MPQLLTTVKLFTLTQHVPKASIPLFLKQGAQEVTYGRFGRRITPGVTSSPQPWQSLLLFYSCCSLLRAELQTWSCLWCSTHLPSHWTNFISPALESFLGSGLHWPHCLVVSVKQGKMVKHRVCKEVNCYRALHGNEWALLVFVAQESPWSFDFCTIYSANAD